MSRLLLDLKDGKSVTLVRRGKVRAVELFAQQINAALKGEPPPQAQPFPPIARRTRFVPQVTPHGVIVDYVQERFFRPDLKTRFEVTQTSFIVRVRKGPDETCTRWDRGDVRDVIAHLRGRDRSGTSWFELHVQFVDGGVYAALKDEREPDVDEVAATLRGALCLASRADLARQALDSPPADEAVSGGDGQLSYEPAPRDQLIMQHVPGLLRIFVQEPTWRDLGGDVTNVILAAVLMWFAMMAFVMWRAVSLPLAIAGAGAVYALAALWIVHVRFRRTTIEVNHDALVRTGRSPLLRTHGRFLNSAIREVLIERPMNSVILRLAGGRTERLITLNKREEALAVARRISKVLGRVLEEPPARSG
jgi:hypothetical protein